MPVYTSGVRLEAQQAAAFVTQMNRASASVAAFQAQTAKGAQFNTSAASSAFAKIASEASRAGQSAGESLSGAFNRSLTGMDGIVSGFFLGLGGQAARAFTGAFRQVGVQIKESISDSLDFGQLVADITAITGDTTTAARAAIAQSVQAAAVDPSLFVNVKQSGEAARSLLKTGQDASSVTANLLEDVILLQNAAGDAAGSLSDYQDAATITGRGLQLFGLEANQARDFVDGVTATLTNSAIRSLNDYQYVLLNSGQAIQSLSLSTDEFNAAIIGTSASFSSGRTLGTAFEAFIRSLADRTPESTFALQQLGVQAFNTQGEFVGLAEVQRQLKQVTEDNVFTQEAFVALMAQGFGSVGAGFGTALIGAQDLNQAMQTVGETSAQAIASIRTDTASAALGNLGDQANALRLSLSLPFTEALHPAIVATSQLLQSLVSQFAIAGQQIAAFFGGAIAGYTSVIQSLTGMLGGVSGAMTPAAAPTYGPAPAPITANSDASAASRAQAAQNLAQQQIGIEQLNAAKEVAKGGSALKSALLSIEDVLSASKVSDLDMRLSREGLYTDATDEFLRRLQAAAESGGSQFGETIEMARAALDKVGITPAQDLLTLYEQTAAAWQSGELFADKANIDLINKAAVEEKAASKKRSEEGRANVAAAFGGLVAGIADGASAGVGAAPVAYQSGLAAGTEAQVKLQDSLNSALNNQIQGVADGINGQGANAFFNPADLYGKQAEQQQVQGGIFASLVAQLEPLQTGLGLVTGLFAGLNAVITGITDAVAGQDFTAAGAAVSGTLTTVLGSLTKMTELADIGTTTANLSGFVQALLNSAAKFTEGIRANDIATSTSDFALAIIGKLGEAFDNVKLDGIVTSASGLAVAVGGKIAEALQNIKFGEIGLATLSLVNKLGGQITGAITEFAGNLQAVDMTKVTEILNGAVSTVTGFAADLTAIDLTGVNEARSAIGGAIAGVATTIATAVDGLDGEAIGSDISAFASNLVGMLADGIKSVPLEEMGVAASNLVGALANTFREAFTVDNLAGVGESIGGLVTGIVEQLTATLGNPAFGETLGAALGDLVAGIVQGAAGLLQGLGDGLEGDALSGLGDALYTFVTGFVGGLVGELATVDWGEVATAVYTGITGAVSDVFSLGRAGTEGEQAQEITPDFVKNALYPVAVKEGITLAGQAMSTDAATAFAKEALYPGTTKTAITDAASSVKTDLATAFAKDALYPPELAGGFSSIAQSISGAFTSIYDAIAGFLSSIQNVLPTWLGGGEKATTPEEPARKEDPEATKSWLESILPAWLGGAQNKTIGPEPFDPAAYAAANNFDGTALVEIVQATSDAQIEAMEEQTKALKPPATTDGSSSLINANTVTELAKLGASSTTVSAAQTAAASAAQNTATVHGDVAESLQSSGGDLNDLFGDLTNIADQLVEAFGKLRPEVAGAAADFDGLDAKLTAYVEVLEGAPGSLTDAFAGLIGAIENAMEKIDGAVDGDNPPPPPTNTGNTPQPFAKGTRYYPGGLGLAGEEDPELYITPGGKAGMLGLRGPELFTAPPGTQIYPADITRQILGRGARPIGGDGIFSAANGAFNSALFGNLPSIPGPITIPPEDTSNRERETANNSNGTGGISTALLAQFLQGLSQQGITVPGVNPSQLAQQVANNAGGTARTTAEQIAELFTRPLMGGRYAAPQTQIININVNQKTDNSQNNYNYNYGGLKMQTMRSTENLQRDFRLLQAVAG